MLRLILLLVSLVSVGVFAAEEPWGTPVTLGDPFRTLEAEDHRSVIDGTGRLWRLMCPPQERGYFLTTWEEDRWIPVHVGLPEVMTGITLSLHLGPQGRAVVGWRDQQGGTVITEVHGLRYRNASPTPVREAGVYLHEDSCGTTWADVAALFGRESGLARPEELKPVLAIPLRSLEQTTQRLPHPRQVHSDGLGHYLLYINDRYRLGNEEHSAPIVIDALDTWTELPERNTDDGLNLAPFFVLKPDGRMLPSMHYMEVHTCMDRQHIGFSPKDEQSFWITSALGIYEVAWATLQTRVWYDAEGAFTVYAMMPQNEKDDPYARWVSCFGPGSTSVLPLGERSLISTPSGLLHLAPDHLDVALQNHASLLPGDERVWVISEDPMTGSSMAFFHAEDVRPHWLGRPKGVSSEWLDLMAFMPDGTLMLAYMHKVITFSPEELQRLAESPAFDPAARPHRVFTATRGPIHMPDGRVFLYINPHVAPGAVAILDGGGWNLHSLESFEWTSYPGQHSMVDDRYRVWLLMPGRCSQSGEDREECFRWLLYDPSSGEARGGDDLFEALSDPTLCPERFFSQEDIYLTPVFGSGGRGVMLSRTHAHFRVDNVWRQPVSLAQVFDPPYEDRTSTLLIDGPCYFNDDDLMCLEHGGQVYVFHADSMTFKLVPEMQTRYLKAERGRHRQQDSLTTFGDSIEYLMAGRMPNLVSGRLKQSRLAVDSLGITWEWKDDALVRHAHDLKLVVLQGEDADVLRGGMTVARIVYDTWGGVFIQDQRYRTVHISATRTAPKTRARVEPVEDGRIRIVFESGEQYGHAWRINRGAWRHSSENEVIEGPFTVGTHVIEAYAYDDDLNVDPSPVRLSIETAGEAGVDALVAAYLTGDADRRQWALTLLQEQNDRAVAAIQAQLRDEKDEDMRWRLEVLLQQLERR